jgi:hypothetical protein
MSVFAADDFGKIRARMLELQGERQIAQERTARSCKTCGQPYLSQHLETCCYAGAVVESELA